MTMQEFLDKFRFNPKLDGCIGVERESFLVDAHGNPVPRSPEFLVGMPEAWTYELSACQVEDRTPPCATEAELRDALIGNWQEGVARAKAIGTSLRCMEVAPETMPVDTYPCERYEQVQKRLGPERLLAACRVAGIHIHIGVSDWADAIRVYRALTENRQTLIALGDHSAGERLRLYREVVGRDEQPVLHSPDDLFKQAQVGGFTEDPRSCWWLVRISAKGTVEVRVFGATDSIPEILSWARAIRHIAKGEPASCGFW